MSELDLSVRTIHAMSVVRRLAIRIASFYHLPRAVMCADCDYVAPTCMQVFEEHTEWIEVAW